MKNNDKIIKQLGPNIKPLFRQLKMTAMNGFDSMIAIGENATIILTGFKNNIPFISIQKIIINEKIDLNVQLKEIDLKDRLSLINSSI